MSPFNIGDPVMGRTPSVIRAMREDQPAPGSIVRGTVHTMGWRYVTVAVSDGTYITLPENCVSRDDREQPVL